MDSALIAIVGVLPWLAVGFGTWLAYQFFLQNGRILLRLEALDKKIGQLAAAHAKESGAGVGLAIGTPAPPFELPDVAGERSSLANFRGRVVLLIFFDPHCGFCLKMAPDLAALGRDGTGAGPLPLVITAGDVKANVDLIEKHNIQCRVLMQTGREIANLYQTTGTPTGYLVDGEGRIATELAIGATAVLALAQRPTPKSADSIPASHEPQYKGNRSLADSRINRSGLSVGTPAPKFTLPRVGGGELSLELFRGRRVVLLFSDPECGPCDSLMPDLMRFAGKHPEVSVLMVGRGDITANESKVERHRVTFPVVVQPHWSISRLYGIFATPVGYLIDEGGTIAAPVAVGAEAIRALLDTITLAETREAFTEKEVVV